VLADAPGVAVDPATVDVSADAASDRLGDVLLGDAPAGPVSPVQAVRNHKAASAAGTAERGRDMLSPLIARPGERGGVCPSDPIGTSVI
jgi:hypothetical protein